jgi:hypothetical protein
MGPKVPTATFEPAAPAGRAFAMVAIDDVEFPASALCDLVSVTTPTHRANWCSLLTAAGHVKRRLNDELCAELPAAVCFLLCELGLTLQSAELTNLLDEVVISTVRSGPDVGFLRLTSVLAGRRYGR